MTERTKGETIVVVLQYVSDYLFVENNNFVLLEKKEGPITDSVPHCFAREMKSQ